MKAKKKKFLGLRLKEVKILLFLYKKKKHTNYQDACYGESYETQYNDINFNLDFKILLSKNMVEVSKKGGWCGKKVRITEKGIKILKRIPLSDLKNNINFN